MSETTYKPSEMAEAIRNLDPTNIHLAGIEVVTPPDKTTYEINDTFDPTGAVIEGSYSQNFKKNVTAGITYSPTELDSTSINSVTATYSERGITKYTNIGIIVYPCKIVSWAGGTDAEIAAMVQAADDGIIDLTDYWDVGDERTVTLSAMSATGIPESHVQQEVVFVLVSKDNKTEDITNPCYNYQYVNNSYANSYPSFIVQQKNCLLTKGVMNDTNSLAGGGTGCKRGVWCNNVYYYSVPSVLRQIFKQVSVKSAESRNGTTIITTPNYFFLPVEKEVIGKRTNGNYTEGINLSQWEYYETAQNTVKYLGNTSEKCVWWTRSMYSSGTQFVTIRTFAGESDYLSPTSALGIAPAGCI